MNPSADEPHPRNWFPVLLAAVCGLGLGVAAGVILGSIRGKSFAEVTAEKDAFAKHNEMIERELLAANRARQSDLATAAKSQIKMEELKKDVRKTREEAERQKTEVKDAWETIVKLEALLCIVRDNKFFSDYLKTEHFRATFKANWYWPDAAFKLIGGRWFFEEMVNQGTADRRVLTSGDSGDFLDALHVPESHWEVLKTYHVDGIKDTESFEMSSALWRVSLEAFSSSGVSVYVYRVGGKASVAMTTIHGAGKDFSLIREPPGRFYLSFIGGPAKVSIETLEFGTDASGPDESEGKDAKVPKAKAPPPPKPLASPPAGLAPRKKSPTMPPLTNDGSDQSLSPEP